LEWGERGAQTRGSLASVYSYTGREMHPPNPLRLEDYEGGAVRSKGKGKERGGKNCANRRKKLVWGVEIKGKPFTKEKAWENSKRKVETEPFSKRREGREVGAKR